MIAVPDRRWYDPVLHATLHTGQPAVDAAYRFPGGVLAIDCETPGLNTFTVNCLTAAWHDGDRVTAVLLDPRRNPGHAVVARDMIAGASRLVLHNAPFDTPILWHAGLLDEPAVRRITDTLLLARLALPDRYVSKSLTALAKRYLGIPDFADGMKLAFKAAGFPTLTAGYERMDIDSPVYRMGALADTVVTLRLLPPLLDAARAWLTDHPFITHGATTAAQADEIIDTQDTVNRVMLLRSAKGLPVNLDYLDRYAERVENDRLRAVAELERAGLAGGAGKASKLIEYLDTLGELPHAWPRTATGKLSATKDLLDKLDHPLAKAQRFLADVDKISGYLAKVSHQAEVTGRCHPQVGILGASQTGRWTVSSPELHQFAADARPIITGDTYDGSGRTPHLNQHQSGLWSIDWCLTGDTEVETVYGGAKKIRDITVGEHVWSWKNGRCVVGTVTMHGQTRPARCATVVLDNGERFTATMNHKMLLRDGTRIRVDHLEAGMSLAAFRRTTDAYGYEVVYSSSAFEYTKTHRAIGELVHGALPEGWHTHHVDGDKRNNHPDNLLYVTPMEHAALTPRTERQRGASSENARVMLEGRRSYVGESNPNYGKLRGEDRPCLHCDTVFYAARAALNRGGGKFCSRECYYAAQRGRTNHKVVAILESGILPVWNMTVEGEHNYALACGVFSGNSQIEPVMLGNMAGGTDPIIESYERGDDLYEPLMRAAGIDRTTSKVCLLASMYGMGVGKLAESIGHNRESAQQIRTQMFAAMPASARFMSRVAATAETHGKVITVAGRILPVTEGGSYQSSNHVIQGSAADQLCHTIAALDAAGLSDVVRIGMHDELVVDCDAEAAAEVERIMRQPLPALRRWSGRDAVLRTDRQEMGDAWMKV